jgi:hypothetical protein
MKWRKIIDKTQYEKVMNFGREIDILDIERYYVLPHEVFCNINIPLYVHKHEAVTVVYLFSKSSSDFIRNNINYDPRSSDQIVLPEEFMYKFELIRVIPAKGNVPIDSYLRVMLKNKDIKYISADD